MRSGRNIETSVPSQRFLTPLALLLAFCLPLVASEQRGEFGADLDLLSSFWRAPQNARESNSYFEMWENQNLRNIVSLNGLTNNHTLFVNCHGKRISSGRFAFYPHQSLINPSAEMPYYSVADLATVVGPANVPAVHNLVLAACNAEGALSTKELRQYFPNATNIIHCVAGELGYQPMFLQAILNCSWTVKPVYEWREKNEKGDVQYVTGHNPVSGAKRLAPYTAELFRQGSEKPFRTQRAGRELLEPEQPRARKR